MSQFHLTTLGEMMLRYSVPIGERLETMAQLDVRPGGAEANLASLLARLGRRTAWVSSLPGNALGRLAANHLRMAGVDIKGVLWNDQGRMGTYYVEFGSPPRPTQVIYDRAHSCMAQIDPDQVDWEYLLDTQLLHFTGITPALSPNCRTLVERAIQQARQRGIPIAFDVNYRQKLWSETEAAAVLQPMIFDCDLLFCGQGDAARLFACQGAPEQVIEQLAAKTRAKRLVVSFGDTGALAWDGEKLHQVPAPTTQIVDRLGAGDALAAGVIHGWLDGDLGAGLRYGVALAALALGIHGDFVITTADELAALLVSSASAGSVSR